MEQLGRVLVSRGLLDEAALRAALEGKPGGAAFIARLLAAGNLGEPEILEALSEYLGMPAVDLSRTVVDLSCLDTVPRHVPSPTSCCRSRGRVGACTSPSTGPATPRRR